MGRVINPTEAGSGSAFQGEFEGITAAAEWMSASPLSALTANWVGVTAAVVALSCTSVIPATFGMYSGAATNEQFYRGNFRRLPPQSLVSQWAEMESYRHLKAGWDGVGSMPIEGNVIDNAQSFLAMLPIGARAPDATVSSDGLVGWYWDGDGKYLDVTFFPDNKIAYYGYSGEIKVSDSAPFDGKSIHQPLLELIALI